MKRVFLLALVTPLWLLACGGSSVGRPCTTDGDCDNGQTCNTAAPGGYCTRGCSAEGNARDCPGGTVCANHSGVLLCSATCQSQGDCRAEYECNGLSGSDQKVCRPKAK